MAVATERLLYAPLPFTGNTWIEEVLRDCGGALVPVARFCPVVEIPPSWRNNRVVFGSIRDPWSWYQALWQTLSAEPDQQVLLRHLGRGRTTFPAFLRGVTDSSTWMSVPSRFTAPLWDWPVGSDGLYTETFRTIYDQGRGFGALVDFAQIEHGLGEVLGMPISGFVAGAIRSLYDDETVDLVQQADGPLATDLGYTGPFTSLPRPARWGGFA